MEEAKVQIRVAVIGAGERGVYVLGARTAELWRETGVVVRVLCDTNRGRAEEGKSYLEDLYARNGADVSIDIEDDYTRVVEREDVDSVFVTNYTSEHRGPAVAALKAGKQVYLDKPMATTLEDARAIMDAEAETEAQGGRPIIMGFTRRYEHSWRKAVELLRGGAIGELQSILLRSVIPYARYLQRWHRNRARSGGALNDKVSHYFDALNWIARGGAVALSATGGRSTVFAPDPTAPRRCRECPRECPFRALPSPWVSEIGTVYRLDPDYRKQDVGIFSRPSWTQAEAEDAQIDNCVYSPENDIIDHAMVNIDYDNGVKATLFWNIYGPSAEDEETIELVGSSGRLRLTRDTGEIDLISDYGMSHEVIDAKGPHFASSHFGADVELLSAVRAHYHGTNPVAGTRDGYDSLRMVDATQRVIDGGGGTISLRPEEGE
ncbi:MAG: Gfo/Idh/MocA family protein [Spirochaetaceae bacterium]